MKKINWRSFLSVFRLPFRLFLFSSPSRLIADHPEREGHSRSSIEIDRALLLRTSGQTHFSNLYHTHHRVQPRGVRQLILRTPTSQIYISQFSPLFSYTLQRSYHRARSLIPHELAISRIRWNNQLPTHRRVCKSRLGRNGHGFVPGIGHRPQLAVCYSKVSAFVHPA